MEKMLGKMLDTRNDHSIYLSLSEVLGVREQFIRYYIIKNFLRISRYSSASEVVTEDFFKFLRKHNETPSLEINKVTIAHLTSRLNSDETNMAPLYNLFDALTNDTEIKRFLEKEELKFVKRKGKLLTYYKDKLVDWSRFYSGSKEPTARMISRRLEGNSFYSADKCVNGFLFNGNIFENGNVTHIYYCPEIVENILEVLKKNNATLKWSQNATPCTFIFTANIDNIIFDGNQNLNNKQKQFRILRFCLYYLSKKMVSEWYEHDNPIIRLKDNINVPPEDIVTVVKLRD